MPTTRLAPKESLIDQCKVLLATVPRRDSADWAETVLVTHYNRIRADSVAAGCDPDRLPAELPTGIASKMLKPGVTLTGTTAPVRYHTLAACIEQLERQIEAML